MDALNYLKIRKRMTKNCGMDCDECIEFWNSEYIEKGEE